MIFCIIYIIINLAKHLKVIEKLNKMKKTFLILAALLLSTSTTFALGIGPQLDFQMGKSVKDRNLMKIGFSCSLTFDDIPFYFTGYTDYDYANNSFESGASADYWIANPKIGNYFSIFFGPGIYAGTSTKGKNIGIYTAARFFAGISFTFHDGAHEIFFQQTVQSGPYFQMGNKSFWDILLEYPVNLGFRQWF